MFQMIDTSKIFPAKWNYKIDDSEKQKELVSRIKERGQIITIIVRELDDGTFESCDGSHRIMAFKELKIDSVMCFNVGKIDQKTAETIGFEVNEMRFAADNNKLDDLLKRIGLKPLEIKPLEPVKIETKRTEMPSVKPITLDPGPRPQSFDARPEKGLAKEKDVQDFETDKTVVHLKLSVDVAAQFKEQLDRVKISMFPKEQLKTIGDTLPIQAICQLLSEIPKERFK